MKRAISPCTVLACAGIDEVACLEKERNIPDVVKTKRDQRAFHDTVERECKAGCPWTAQCEKACDPVADWGPNKA